MDSKTFEVEIASPHGEQPIEEFRHYLSKVQSDAKARWGIEITISEQREESASTDEFN